MIGEGAGTPLTTDVLVIGGGAAGAFAALAARERGLEVAVVRRAWGATALSSGAADVAPDPMARPALQLGGRKGVAEAAMYLAMGRPDHPYALLRESLFRLPEALAFASVQTGGLLSFVGADKENHAFLSPLGVLKPSAGGLASIAAGDLLRVADGGTIGVVGFDHVPVIDAPLLARAAEEAATQAGLSLRAVPLECDFFRHAGDALLRPHELAERLEADPERLVASLRRVLPPSPLSLLLFPPILSRVDPGATLRLLQERLGIACAELPAGSQSLPGFRLQQALEARLAQAGIGLIAGEVFVDDAIVRGRSAGERRDRVLRALDGGLRLRSSAPTVPPASDFDTGVPHPAPLLLPSSAISARAVILATGKFIGGGIRREGALLEPIFDLPVWVGGRIERGRWLGDLTQYELKDEQPALRAGVRIDAQLRPVLEGGEPASERLFACGGLLAGNDPAQDGAGIGLAIFTGYLAGLAARERVASGEGGRR